jgi:cellulose synthase/poly-beta-1,6-N-acetylglucosamine synthase-like glycosyltransferase
LLPITLLLSLLYAISTILLMGYSFASLLLVLIHLVNRRRYDTSTPPFPEQWPSVVVQLPIYNEAHVVHRLIDAVAAIDYPRDRFSIQILDDSTDHTTALIQSRVEKYRAAGIDIVHVRRPVREGFKAGALAYGMAHTDAELITIFDADFLPPPDFLRRTMPHLAADPLIGVVQARWGHLNDAHSFLTRAQALAIDMHFVIQQHARSSAGLLLNFSGSAGVWRRACIEDAGGWRADTLTEDLDLSYRAQLRGWRCLLLPHVVVPAELPPQIAAYKRQQARWAKGGTQCLRLHGMRVLRAKIGPFKKIMALVHLAQYLTHPLMLMLLLLAVPLVISGALWHLPFIVMLLLGLTPFATFVISQRPLYKNWLARWPAIPALAVVTAAISLNNSLAIGSVFIGRPGEFERTPKFGRGKWHSSRYALLAGRAVVGEIALALYAGAGVVAALMHDKPAAVPFFLIYTLANGGAALITLMDGRRVARRAMRPGRQPDSSQAV